MILERDPFHKWNQYMKLRWFKLKNIYLLSRIRKSSELKSKTWNLLFIVERVEYRHRRGISANVLKLANGRVRSKFNMYASHKSREKEFVLSKKRERDQANYQSLHCWELSAKIMRFVNLLLKNLITTEFI